MPKITDPNDIHYLALEGGGGKGVTYLGAVQALEDFGVLPVGRRSPYSDYKGPIEGISGASAGAITALFLAMGYTHSELETLFDPGNISKFNEFFDDPVIGKRRGVNEKNAPEIFGSQHADNILFKALLVAIDAVARIIPFNLFAKIYLTKYVPFNLSNKIMDHLEKYVHSLLCEGGVFSGFAALAFFQTHLTEWIKKQPYGKGRKGSEINFEEFYEISGVNLVISAVNVVKHKPVYFSAEHTPKFPVAEAVAISMNLPLVFKPIEVKAVGEMDEELGIKPEDYIGRFVDGGLLNNLPIHAFDYLMTEEEREEYSMHPNILGLRLTEGIDPLDIWYKAPEKKAPEQNNGAYPIWDLLADLLPTLLYPSEEGQIRSLDERSQTIELYTYELSTLEFAPSIDKRRNPVARASMAVYEYFKNPGRK